MRLTAGVRRTSVVVLLFVGGLGLASCVPNGGGTTTTTTPPPPVALLSPTAGPAGSFVDVAPPGGDCLNPAYSYSSLQASLTTYKTGIVLSSGYQFIGQSFSTNASPDPFVRLHIPPALATGKYLVYLSCYNYLESYEYAPATFTVTAS